MIANDDNTRRLIDSIVSTWRATGLADARGALREHAQLSASTETAVELCYEEYRLRLERGEPLSPTDFCARFPEIAGELKRVLEVDSAIQRNWPRVGEQLERFKLLKQIGSGALSIVFIARDETLKRLVTLKVTPSDFTEAQQLAQLPHDHIVTIHEVVAMPERELVALAMPYQGSATLLDLLKEHDKELPRRAERILEVVAACNEPLKKEFEEISGSDRGGPPVLQGSYTEGVVTILAKLSGAVAFMHRRRVLHQDLKPNNVLLTPNGSPQLLDFNLARSVDESQGPAGGTLPYMAPEQVRDAFFPLRQLTPDGKSDVYALGVLLAQLLTGRHPWGEIDFSRENVVDVAQLVLERQRHLNLQMADRNPEVDAQLNDLVARCLAWNPADRPEAAQLEAALHQWLAARRSAPSPPAPLPQAQTAPATRRVWVAALAACVLCGVGLAAAAIFQISPWKTRPVARPIQQWRVELQAALPVLGNFGTESQVSFAISQARKAVDDDMPLLALQAYDRCLRAYNKDHVKSGVDLYATLIANGYQGADAYNNLAAELIWKRKELDRAAELIDRAVQLAPNALQPRCNRMRLIGATGRQTNGSPDMGLTDAEFLIQRFPERDMPGEVHHLLARVYLANFRRHQTHRSLCRKHLEAAIALDAIDDVAPFASVLTSDIRQMVPNKPTERTGNELRNLRWMMPDLGEVKVNSHRPSS